jgi:hypothetical protein
MYYDLRNAYTGVEVIMVKIYTDMILFLYIQILCLYIFKERYLKIILLEY